MPPEPAKKAKARRVPHVGLITGAMNFRERWKTRPLLRPFAAAELTALLAWGLVLSRQTKLYSYVNLFSRPNPNVLPPVRAEFVWRAERFNLRYRYMGARQPLLKSFAYFMLLYSASKLEKEKWTKQIVFLISQFTPFDRKTVFFIWSLYPVKSPKYLARNIAKPAQKTSVQYQAEKKKGGWERDILDILHFRQILVAEKLLWIMDMNMFPGLH